MLGQILFRDVVMFVLLGSVQICIPTSANKQGLGCPDCWLSSFKNQSTLWCMTSVARPLNSQGHPATMATHLLNLDVRSPTSVTRLLNAGTQKRAQLTLCQAGRACRSPVAATSHFECFSRSGFEVAYPTGVRSLIRH